MRDDAPPVTTFRGTITPPEWDVGSRCETAGGREPASPDTSIWEHSKAGDDTIVTADADFYELATTLGRPKVIWLRGCDYQTAVAEQPICGQAIRVTEFLEDPDRAVLILTP